MDCGRPHPVAEAPPRPAATSPLDCPDLTSLVLAALLPPDSGPHERRALAAEAMPLRGTCWALRADFDKRLFGLAGPLQGVTLSARNVSQHAQLAARLQGAVAGSWRLRRLVLALPLRVFDGAEPSAAALRADPLLWNAAKHWASFQHRSTPAGSSLRGTVDRVLAAVQLDGALRALSHAPAQSASLRRMAETSPDHYVPSQPGPVVEAVVARMLEDQRAEVERRVLLGVHAEERALRQATRAKRLRAELSEALQADVEDATLAALAQQSTEVARWIWGLASAGRDKVPVDAALVCMARARAAPVWESWKKVKV